MKPATPSNSTKAERRPTCPNCKTRFRTTSTNKKFCTTDCQKEATKLKRRVSYIHRATNSAFFYQLAFEAERAGTLEIFTGHTVESLVALYEVYKLCLKANQYGEAKHFEISHICAVKGIATVGLYHAKNLVVAPIALNRAHGTKYFGHGLSIPRTTLKPRNFVAKGDSRKDTIERIIKFIGESIVSEAVRIAKIQPTQRHKVLSWLHDHLDPLNPEHQRHLEKLDGMTGKALTALKSELLGKEGSSFKLKGSHHSPLYVLFLELQRHVAIRPDLSEVSDFISKRINPYAIEYKRQEILSATELQALFDVLHGKEVSDVRHVFVEMLAAHNSITYRDERIPNYSPIVFTGRRAANAPAKLLQTFSNFADELDSGAINIAPVMLQAHTPTYEADSLPWD